MKPNEPIIIGAGLAGLLAAHAWPTARIYESAPAPRQQHKAVLRFRTDVVSRLTGIEFRKVTVRKGIFFADAFVAPSIRLHNLYSRKVLGGALRDRSIWSVDPAERFIAPEDFYDQLVEAANHRIRWDTGLAALNGGILSDDVIGKQPVISTIPLPVMLAHLCCEGFEADSSDYQKQAIRVSRWRIPDCDLYQTVYFPELSTPIYRASITGDLLIVEEVHAKWNPETAPLDWVCRAFGLSRHTEFQPLGETVQQYGKIDSLDPTVRKRLLYRLTSQHRVYSLGRFATWRNILLDDVINDIAVIKRLLRADTAYDVKKAVA